MVLDILPKVAGTIGSGDIPFTYGNFVSDYSLATGAMLVSTNSTTSTSISITTGTSMVFGFQVREDGTGSLPVSTSATAYIYVAVTLNASNKPTAVSYTTNATDGLGGFSTNGFYHYRIAKVVSTTKVDTIADLRPQSPWSAQQFLLVNSMGLF